MPSLLTTSIHRRLQSSSLFTDLLHYLTCFVLSDVSATCYSSQQNGDDLIAAGGNDGEYLGLAKKGRGHPG